MPLTVKGENYRVFADPDMFEAETTSQVEQIINPVDKGFALCCADDGSGDFTIWKFNADSTEAASASVLVPDNPLYADEGRWILVLTGTGGGGGGPNFLSGVGDPNGVVTGEVVGQTYLQTDDDSLWVFNGTVGGNTGWV